MKILVTGGAGYIGSHTAKALKSEGHTPVVVDNLTYGHKWAVQWGEFYQEDITNTAKLVEILKKEKIEAVLHFAAFAYVGESVKDPLKYYQNNVLGTLSLLEAMRLADVSKIIFSSTCATYGIPDKSPIEENFSQAPINPYGRSKLMSEMILKDYVRAHGFSATSLRYFNASGADRDLQIGEDHNPETHLIPLAIEATHEKDKQLTVFGRDYPTPDGTCIRDYIHVNDLAAAHVLALKYLKEKEFATYNLGTGQGFSVQQVIEQIQKTTGKKVNFKNGSRREGDPPILVASGSKAKTELNWSPSESSLHNIVETANAWYLKHFGVQRG